MNAAIQTEVNALKKIIVNAFPVEQIYFFGSHAYGVPDKHSDIDLYVVLKDDAPIQNFDAVMQIRKAIAYTKTMPVDIVVKKKNDFLTCRAENSFVKKGKKFLGKLPDVEETLEETVLRLGICIYG